MYGINLVSTVTSCHDWHCECAMTYDRKSKGVGGRKKKKKFRQCCVGSFEHNIVIIQLKRKFFISFRL